MSSHTGTGSHQHPHPPDNPNDDEGGPNDDEAKKIQCILCGGWDIPGQHDCPELEDDDDIWDTAGNIISIVTGPVGGVIKAGWDFLWSYEDEMIDWYIKPYTEATDETPDCDYCKKGCSSCGSSSSP